MIAVPGAVKINEVGKRKIEIIVTTKDDGAIHIMPFGLDGEVQVLHCAKSFFRLVYFVFNDSDWLSINGLSFLCPLHKIESKSAIRNQNDLFNEWGNLELLD